MVRVSIQVRVRVRVRGSKPVVGQPTCGVGG